MQIRIYKDQNTLSLQAAEEIFSTVKNKPDAVLCLAAGDTPKLAYGLLAQRAMAENLDFSACTFIGLDEWIGISPGNPGSCHFFLENLLFKPLNIQHSQVHLFNSMQEDLAGECNRMNQVIAGRGGIDLMLVGVGMNGHVGFNEPGVSPDLYTHVMDLDSTTLSVGQKYFRQATVLKQGITLGFRHILHSRKLIMMASGEKKADVIRRAIEENITTDLPASYIRKHPDGIVMLDQEAASLLSRNKNE